MSYESIGKMIDLWMNDEAFREQVKKDPRAAARKAGIQLSEEELAALRGVDWSLSDQQLQARISKAM